MSSRDSILRCHGIALGKICESALDLGSRSGTRFHVVKIDGNQGGLGPLGASVAVETSVEIQRRVNAFSDIGLGPRIKEHVFFAFKKELLCVGAKELGAGSVVVLLIVFVDDFAASVGVGGGLNGSADLVVLDLSPPHHVDCR